MSTQFRDERKAIEGRFQAAWVALGTPAPVKYENAPFTPPTAAPWVELVILRGQGDVASLGDAPLLRYVGLVVARVFVPKGQGIGPADDLADKVAGIFLTATGAPVQFASGSSGLITCRPPELSPAEPIEEGPWVLSVTIPFERDQTIS